MVDDNATNRRILEDTLRQWAIHPTVVASGAEGLRAIAAATKQGEPFTLVLLDANMPEMDGFGFAERLRGQREWEQVTVLMLSSAGHRDDAARCRQLGIRGYLTKPIKRSELLETMLAVVCPPSVDDRPGHPLVTRHTLREARAPLRILLAEDNPVNQRLAARLLEKEGHTIKITGTGREAVTAWSQARPTTPFDLVLMDVQMPDMDGLEATGAIRAQEAGNGDRVPIIAMTAHAMAGDRERCLAAGMDDYLAKPLVTRDLWSILAQVTTGRRRRIMAAPGDPSTNAESVWVPDVALALADGDRELLQELVSVALDNVPSQLTALRDAVEAADTARTVVAAHTLKGTMAAIGALGLVEAAGRLEELGRGRDLSGVTAALGLVERDTERLTATLIEFSTHRTASR